MIFFCVVLLCIFATSSEYLLPLLDLYPFCSLTFLKRSLVFPILLFLSISLHCSLRKAFLSLPAILWNSAFRCVYLFSFAFHFFFSQLFVRPPQTTILPLFFFCGGGGGRVDGFDTASYKMLQISSHGSSGTLCIRSNPMNLFVTSTV